MWPSFLKGGKKKATHTVAPLAPGLRETIVNTIGAQAIPSMPPAAQQAFSLSTNPKAELREFVTLIESDEALTARVLKVANSVYFARGARAETIEQSAVTIGIDELKSLLTASTLRDLFPSRNPIRTYLWNHDLAVAAVAKYLSKELRIGDEEQAYLAGLMHDLGKLLILQKLPKQYEQIVKKVETTGRSFLELERELLAFDHTEVGHLIADRWAFSAELTTSLTLHHTVSHKERDSTNPLPQLVCFANILVHLHERASDGHFRKYGESFETELWQDIDAVYGMRAADRTHIMETVKERIERERGINS